MRRVITISVLVFFCSINFGQTTSSDKKAGEIAGTSELSAKENVSNDKGGFDSLFGESKAEKSQTLVASTEGGAAWKYYLMGGAAAFSMLFVGIRRAAKKKQSDKVNELKRNIRMMREEKVIMLDDTERKMVRESLSNPSRKLVQDERFITSAAKKFNISKGEIELAARVRSAKERLEYLRSETMAGA